MRYQRLHGVLRAAADIPQGSYLGRLALPEAYPDAGEERQFTVAIGPVRVQRRVELMQPAPAGAAAFVRDETGEVFAAPLDLLLPSDPP
jgi:hypothetical protein